MKYFSTPNNKKKTFLKPLKSLIIRPKNTTNRGFQFDQIIPEQHLPHIEENKTKYAPNFYSTPQRTRPAEKLLTLNDPIKIELPIVKSKNKLNNLLFKNGRVLNNLESSI